MYSVNVFINITTIYIWLSPDFMMTIPESKNNYKN